MGFDTSRQKEFSQKIVLVEIDIPLTNNALINYEAGIWFNKLNWGGVTVEGSDGETGFYSNEQSEVFDVSSLKVDNIDYTKLGSLTSLRVQNESFYFNKGSQEIYINFDDYNNPRQRVISLGISSGFSMTAKKDSNGRPLDSYYNNDYYKPCVTNIPNITQNKDPLFFGIISFNGGTIEFDNKDGSFDSFADQDVYAQPVRILLGFDDLVYSEYEKVFSGYVEDFGYTHDVFRLNVQDNRKKLSRKLPVNRVTKSTYTYLNDDDVDKPIPIAWGSIRKAPAIVVNRDEPGSPSWTVLFLDTTNYPAKALTTVWVDGVQKTPASTNLAAGTFTLANADYTDGDDVIVQFEGFSDGGSLIENGLDVLKDILNTYADISFLAENYNLSEWISETSKALNVAFWIGDGEEQTIRDAIETISVSMNGIFLYQDNGLITFRTYDSNRSVTRVIQNDEWINKPVVDYPSSDFLSSIKIKYSKNFDANTFRSYLNDDEESTVFARYRQYRQATVETVLATETDADTKSDRVMEISKEISQVVKRKTKTQNVDLEIMQFIACEHARTSEAVNDYKTYEIIGIMKDLKRNEVALTMRFVEDYVETGLGYLQGDIWKDYIFGHRIHSITNYYVE
ncbi:MAG: hypothetical protein JSW06_02795 [Thermoplasmatales archaeon]|nr:MAG: hypothetical protein JSW06_02795 [Thermoplasmatales archaeon]